MKKPHTSENRTRRAGSLALQTGGVVLLRQAISLRRALHADDDEFYPAKSGHPDGIRALNRKQAAAATQQAACAHNGKGRGNFHMKEGSGEKSRRSHKS